MNRDSGVTNTIKMEAITGSTDDAKVNFLQGYLARMTARYLNDQNGKYHLISDSRPRRASFQTAEKQIREQPQASRGHTKP